MSTLLITININGLNMRMEAIEGTTTLGSQRPRNPAYDNIGDAYGKADDSGSPFLTTKIHRRTFFD